MDGIDVILQMGIFVTFVIFGLVMVGLKLAPLKESKPKRLYVIIGELTESWKAPNYSTDIRDYGLDIFDGKVSDAEFEKEDKDEVKAFKNTKDAVQFAWSCNMAGVACRVFDLVDSKWVKNEKESGKLVEELSKY